MNNLYSFKFMLNCINDNIIVHYSQIVLCRYYQYNIISAAWSTIFRSFLFQMFALYTSCRYLRYILTREKEKIQYLAKIMRLYYYITVGYCTHLRYKMWNKSRCSSNFSHNFSFEPEKPLPLVGSIFFFCTPKLNRI